MPVLVYLAIGAAALFALAKHAAAPKPAPPLPPALPPVSPAVAVTPAVPPAPLPVPPPDPAPAPPSSSPGTTPGTPEPPAPVVAAPTPAPTMAISFVPATTLDPGTSYIVHIPATPGLEPASAPIMFGSDWTLLYKPGDPLAAWPAPLPYPDDPDVTDHFVVTGTWSGGSMPLVDGHGAVRALPTPDVITNAEDGPFLAFDYKGVTMTLAQADGLWAGTVPLPAPSALGRSRDEVVGKLQMIIDAAGGAPNA